MMPSASPSRDIEVTPSTTSASRSSISSRISSARADQDHFGVLGRAHAAWQPAPARHADGRMNASGSAALQLTPPDDANRSGDRLHLAADRDFRRGLVVGDDDVVLAAVLAAATGRRPAASWRYSSRRTAALLLAQLDAARRSCLRSVAAIALTSAAGSAGSAARFSTSTATSNSAWMKPIGCVHCRPVASGEAGGELRWPTGRSATT